MRLHSAIPKRVSEGGCGNLLNRVSEAKRGRPEFGTLGGHYYRGGNGWSIRGKAAEANARTKRDLCKRGKGRRKSEIDSSQFLEHGSKKRVEYSKHNYFPIICREQMS